MHNPLAGPGAMHYEIVNCSYGCRLLMIIYASEMWAFSIGGRAYLEWAGRQSESQ